MAESPDFEGILRSLVESNARFVLIGGLAMIAQGSANLTTDIDLLYARSPANIERIVHALRAVHPQLRTPREPIPMLWDTEFFKNVMNVTLTTDMGPVDLLAEAPGKDAQHAMQLQAPKKILDEGAPD